MIARLLVATPLLVVLVSSSASAAERPAPRAEPELGWGGPAADFHVHFWPDPVNVKNANFFLPSKDIAYPAAGFPLEIERSYNSRSLSDGPLGFGWSFNYDIYVRVGEDGLPEVVDADGFVCKFLPQGGGGVKSALELSVMQYLAAKKDVDVRSGIVKPPDYYAGLKTRLMNDQKLFEQLKKDMPNLALEASEGQYISTTRGVQQLEVRKEGYKRTFSNGVTHLFYRSGKLRQMIDPSGSSLAMRYSKGNTGDLTDVSHSAGKRLEFQVGKFGKITAARDPEGKQVFYNYDARGDLVGYKDTQGRITRYEYDEWHNMTKITFPNGDVIQNKYQTEKDWILAQKGPGTNLTQYEYGTDAADDSHYWTIVDDNGVKTRYDYYDSQNRVVTTEPNGQKTDRTFSECCGKPLKVIEADGRQINYEYDKRGNATRIWDNRGQNARYEYDPKWSKVTKYITPKTKTEFQYDATGNLVMGRELPSNTVVRMQYTPDGRVRSVDNGAALGFDFKYNAAGKPVQIAPKGGKGAVQIDYGADGSVTAVKAVGQVDQRQVLGDLQKLIAVIEPAYKFEL